MFSMFCALYPLYLLAPGLFLTAAALCLFFVFPISRPRCLVAAVVGKTRKLKFSMLLPGFESPPPPKKEIAVQHDTGIWHVTITCKSREGQNGLLAPPLRGIQGYSDPLIMNLHISFPVSRVFPPICREKGCILVCICCLVWVKCCCYGVDIYFWRCSLSVKSCFVEIPTLF